MLSYLFSLSHHSVSLPSPRFFSPASHPVFPKYVSLYHMWHGRIVLSEAGNDFFVLSPALRGIRVVLVIRPFITLPARHSSCPGKCNLSWFTQLPQDGERKRNISHSGFVGQREFREIHKERAKGCSRAFLTGQAICMWTICICLDTEDVRGVSPLTEK